MYTSSFTRLVQPTEGGSTMGGKPATSLGGLRSPKVILPILSSQATARTGKNEGIGGLGLRRRQPVNGDVRVSD